MAILIEALLIFSAGMLPNILGSLLFEKFQEYNKKLTNPENLIRLWSASVATIAAALYVALNQPNGLSSIGVMEKSSENFITAFWATGLLALLLLLAVLIHELRKRGKEPEPRQMDLTLPLIRNTVRYSTPIERNAYLIVLSLLVIGEDFVSRGYLVLMMARRTGVLLPWIILSILFSVVCHLYQGRNRTTVIFHSLFAIYFIAMILITGNIIAAIAPHLFYDILWTKNIWRGIDKQFPELARPSISTRERLFYFGFIAVNLTLLLYFLFFLV